MSKQSTNSGNNTTQTPKLNLQIQNVYQCIYNQQIFHKLARQKAIKLEEEAQGIARHLGMLYNTMGFALKQAVLSIKFTGQKQQKLQNFTKLNSVVVPIQAIQRQFLLDEQENEITMKQKRQKAQKKLLQEMMAENEAVNQQSAKPFQYFRPNLLMKQFDKSSFQNIQDIEQVNDCLFNLQKSTQKQQQRQVMSQRNQASLQNCQMQKKHQVPFQKNYNIVENKQYDQVLSSDIKDSKIKKIIKSQGRNICQFEQMHILKETKQINNKSEQEVGQVNHTKSYNVDKSFTKDKMEHLNNQCQTHKDIKNQQIKHKNINNILTTEQQKIHQNKIPKMCEIISLDEYQQQNPKLNHKRSTSHHQEGLQSEIDYKIVKNISIQGPIQNYHSTMKKKFRGQKLGKVCSFCNLFYQSAQGKQNFCRCRQLESKSQRKRRFSQQICLSDNQ